jgi:DNA-binding response OmpR family regulator
MTAPNDKPIRQSVAAQDRIQTALLPKRSRILMAEDDPVSARLLQAALTKFGYEPVIARDGDEAWKIFDHDPVRLIVSDWMMPGLDGLAFCEKVRARPQTPYTYFILVTANHTSASNYEMASAAGVDDFLVKPLDREAIQMRLRVAERILKYTAEIRQLQELIPICTYCHKVRNQHDYWDLVESYIQKQTGSRFTHCACPQCYEQEMERLQGGAAPA